MKNFSRNISEYFKTLYSEQFVRDYEFYSSQKGNTYIRIMQCEDEKAIIENLIKYGIELEQIANIPFAYLVKSGEDLIGKTIEYILGFYYIQSLSSMLPPLVLNPKTEEKILDLCAAPGSKTTQLSAMLNYSGQLYSNEVNPKRIRSLINNIERYNLCNTAVLFQKGENLCNRYHNFFDKILVDAPCSGLGILNKYEEINKWWSLEHIERLQHLQFHLLVSAAKMLKIGGEIIYSTCTMSVEENEELLNKLIDKYPLELVEINLPIKTHNGFTKYQEENFNESLIKTKRIIPWEINSEGFFIAKLIKKGDINKNINYKELHSSNEELLSYQKKNIYPHIKNLSEYYGIPIHSFENYKYLLKKNEIYFVSKEWSGEHISDFHKFGLLLCYIDNHGRTQIYYNGMKALEKHITKNIVELKNLKELETLFTGGTIRNLNDTLGQKIVRHKNYFLGTAVMTKEGLKSQFPKALRAQVIVYPE